MKRVTMLWAGVLLATVWGLAGCGEGGASGGKATSIPDSPEGTVKAVASSLANNQPRAVWDAMPGKWQTDVNSLVSEFAGKMDAEVYDTTFATVGKLSDTLKEKKALILQALEDPQISGNMPITKADLEARYDTLVSFLGTIARSDASTVNGLKSLDIGKFLGNTGATLMADMDKLAELAPDPDAAEMIQTKKDLANVQVEVVSSSADAATVKITTGDKVEQEEMVKVEGKWVPKEMADEWDAKIAEAKANLAEMTGQEMAQNKPQVMQLLKSIDTRLTTVSKASTPDELKQAVMGMVGAVMGQMMGGGGMGPDDAMMPPDDGGM